MAIHKNYVITFTLARLIRGVYIQTITLEISIDYSVYVCKAFMPNRKC